MRWTEQYGAVLCLHRTVYLLMYVDRISRGCSSVGVAFRKVLLLVALMRFKSDGSME